MKSMWKRFTAAILAAALVMGAAVMPGQAVVAEAASKPHMEKVNVKWDLKNNETLTYKTRYAGIGMVEQKVKMSGYKIKDSKKKGYKELTCTLKHTRQWKVKPNQVHKILHSKEFKKIGYSGGDSFFAVLDYNSGESLGVRNKQNVVLTTSDFKFSKLKYYDHFVAGTQDICCRIGLCNVTMKIKVTYPKNYKGLCIGVGGMATLKQTKNNEKFWQGEVPFSKTSFYSKKDKSVAHFMRVTK